MSQQTNPYHQPETEFVGELQQFTGPAIDPDDPSLEPRERKGRPVDSLPQKHDPNRAEDDE